MLMMHGIGLRLLHRLNQHQNEMGFPMAIEILEVNRLAEIYINYSLAEDSDKYLYDDFFDIDDLCDESPNDAWVIMLKILEITDDPKVLQVLSAGLLEDLLSIHPEKIIDYVESEAEKNPKFKDLLKGVWKSDIPDNIWNRVQKSRT